MKFYAPKYKQIDLGLLRSSFNELDKTNRWVALGDLLPWTELEKENNSRLRKRISEEELNKMTVKLLNEQRHLLKEKRKREEEEAKKSDEKRTLIVILKMYYQQKEMYKSRSHTCVDRILSIFQPHVRAIIRGKAKARTEFGAKIGASIV